eukprot:179652-Rhodomonas_salina.3
MCACHVIPALRERSKDQIRKHHHQCACVDACVGCSYPPSGSALTTAPTASSASCAAVVFCELNTCQRRPAQGPRQNADNETVPASKTTNALPSAQ